MLYYLAIAVLVLCVVLAIQTLLFALAGRKIFGLENSLPLNKSIIRILTPDANTTVTELLKKYFDLLSGRSLMSFIRIAKSMNSLTDEEHDALNAKLDLINTVVTDFIKPVIVSQVTYMADDVDDYKIKAQAIADHIAFEIKSAKTENFYEPYSYYTERLVNYVNRIDGDLDTIASIVVEYTTAFTPEYIEQQIKLRNPSKQQ